MLSRILTINSRTFRHGYSSFFAGVGESPAGAIVLIARSVSTIGHCYGGTVLVGSNGVVTSKSGSSITSRCALRGVEDSRGRDHPGGGRRPRKLGSHIPAFQFVPISPAITGYSSAFGFSVRCRCGSSSNCVTVTVGSVGHNKVPCSSNRGGLGIRGNRRVLRVSVPLTLFGGNRFHLMNSFHARGLRSSGQASVVTCAGSSGSLLFTIESGTGAESCTLLGSHTVQVRLVSCSSWVYGNRLTSVLRVGTP